LSFSGTSQQEPHHYHLHDSKQNHQKRTKDIVFLVIGQFGSFDAMLMDSL
jgi:hypothetical protein